MANRSEVKSTDAGTETNGMKKKVLTSSKAALPMGPYSQGIQVGNLIFVAGEKGIDAKTGKVVPGGIMAETRQTFENIKAILEQAGATLDDAVSSTVHMTDLKEFQDRTRSTPSTFMRRPPVALRYRWLRCLGART